MSSITRVHLNWTGCIDWHNARARLRFLQTTLYGNFADVDGDVADITVQLATRGFKVERMPDMYGAAQLRLSGGVVPMIKPDDGCHGKAQA